MNATPIAGCAAQRQEVRLAPGADVDGFRRAVRTLVAEDMPPEGLIWSTGEAELFAAQAPPAATRPFPLPRAVVELVDTVICHRDPERHALLYSLVWRTLHGEPHLVGNPADPLVHRLSRMAKSVRRDIHKMHAFVRFRAQPTNGGRERFVAWFEPEHFILEAVSGFFVRRFPSLDWTILTPLGSLRWDGSRFDVGPPASRHEAPQGDGFEEGWLSYYESTFNPARANPEMMRQHMPKKYWANLPEAAVIPGLLQAAPTRTGDLLAHEPAAPRKRDPLKAVAAMSDQEPATLDELNRIIAQTPPFVVGGTRAVLGEGPMGAALALVGEQPGDEEDRLGHPFVGPAGQLLMRAMTEAGLSRERVYLTNAVKHFKFVLQGKRRLHQKPTTGEVKHYRWWLRKELDFVHPRLVVALGGTAALALTGRAMSVTRERGPADFEGRPGFITTHPSYLLRLPDEAAKAQAYEQFVADLRAAGKLAGEGTD